jgi:low affinity sulfate transporter 2
MEWVMAEVETSNEKARERVQSVVLDMSNVVNIDTSGLVGLEEIHQDLLSMGIQVKWLTDKHTDVLASISSLLSIKF